MKKETELFAPVKNHFEGNGHVVYSEVTGGYGGKRADIVTVYGKFITIVELKLTMSLDLIRQAVEWKGSAHHVWVGVPKRMRPNDFAVELLKERGVGILMVDDDRVEVYQHPKLERRLINPISNCITTYHQDYSPDGGTKGGGYITPYRVTMIKVKEFLTACRTGRWWDVQPFINEDDKGRRVNPKQGWVDMNTLLLYCQTHYASPKQSLAQALISFESEWCEVKVEGGKRYYRLKTGS